MELNATDYETPEMRVIEITLELGFANSIEDPSENEEIDW